ncbi:MAG: hypothetical protein ACTSXD_02085 [Candidatus Heimdallarchaeaceae archaeon]
MYCIDCAEEMEVVADLVTEQEGNLIVYQCPFCSTVVQEEKENE